MHATTIFASFATAALVSFAEAHGIVSKIEVAGQTFNSPLINAGGDTGPFYVPSSNSPVTDVTSTDMFCNAVGNAAKSTPSIDLSQGNTISFYWNSGYSAGTNWPHNTGPMFLYMAKCNGDCSSMTASSTNFIKIQQSGIVNGQWVQAELHSGSPATFTIPSDLASGNYLLRHEVINLASTDENFPACSQFAIQGGSNDYSSAQTAKFPGAYAASDPGLTVAGSAVYSIKSDASYTFPGPDPVASSDGSSSGSSSSSNSTVASSSASGSSATGVSLASAVPSVTSDLLVSTSISLPSVLSSPGSAAVTAPEVTSTSTSSSSSGSSSDEDACSAQWTACNAAWLSAESGATSTAGVNSTTGSESSYTCQTQYESCVAGTSFISSMESATTDADTATATASTSSVNGTSASASTGASSVIASSGASSVIATSGASITAITGASSASASVASPSIVDTGSDSATAATATATASVSAPSQFLKHLRRHHVGLSRLEFH